MRAERALPADLAARPDQIVAAAIEILRQDPHRAEAWESAARIFLKHRKWKDARGWLESAIKFIPDRPLLQVYYALALLETGDAQDAFTRINAVLGKEPDYPEALFAKAEILNWAGYYDLARRYFAAAEKHEPLRKASVFGKGIVDFMTGKCALGLDELVTLEEDAPDAPPLPLWKGRSDPALHLLAYSSQGFGDILMFLRYIDVVRPMVGKLTLRAPHQLAHLIRSNWPDLPLCVTRDPGDTRGVTLPDGVSFNEPDDATACCPLMRLAIAVGNFNARVEKVPYLRADPEKIRVMRERLVSIPKPHIGLVWAGNPRHQADHVRSISFDTLGPIMDAAKPHIISLQMGPQRDAGIQAGLFDGTEFITDFSDTAALMEALDLLITVDTAPAHLAGALGKPVWALIPFGHNDWRWLLEREDTIWYPSMRLFRQTSPGDWPSVANTVAKNLQKFIGGDVNILKAPAWKGGFPSRQPHAVPLLGIEGEIGF